MLETTFNKFIGLKACNFIKKDSFNETFIRTPSFTKHFRWSLLEGVGGGASLVKILQDCRFNIFGINRRCLRKMLNMKNNE